MAKASDALQVHVAICFTLPADYSAYNMLLIVIRASAPPVNTMPRFALGGVRANLIRLR